MKKLAFSTVVAVSIGAAACSSSSSGGAVGTVPTIATTTSGSLTLDAAKHANVNYSVTNFTVQAPGTGCAASSNNCGHIHLLIDGTACNGPGAPYNIEVNGPSPAVAQFNLCGTPTGAHTLTMELHHDDHSAVKDANGNTVSVTSNVTTQ